MEPHAEALQELVRALRAVQAKCSLDKAALARLVAEALTEIPEVSPSGQPVSSLGIVVRAGVAVPTREFHH